MNRATLLFIVLVFMLGVHRAGAAVPVGFTEVVVATGLNAPTAMAFAPDNRLFITEQNGGVRIIQGGALLPTPAIDLDVDPAGERGLLGLAFHPNFATNGYLYLYYTVPAATRFNRISRFTVVGNTINPASEVVLMNLENLTGATNHNGGAMHFGPDGMLYVAVGDNATAANSQNPANRLGKILRLTPDGAPAPGNPTFTPASHPAVWAIGLRNPFTFAFQPGSGRMFINDVGQNAWEEVNEGTAGANYGWPATEGYHSNPAFVSPFYAYGHGGGGNQGCAITGGTFYNPPVAAPGGYAAFVGDYFYADYCNDYIRRLDLPSNTSQPFATNLPGGVVDVRVGPEGSLYYLARNGGQVVRIDAGTNLPPTIDVPPTSQTVSVGQSATFSCTASGSPTLAYQWQRDGVNIGGATGTTYTTPPTVIGDDGAVFTCVVTNLFGQDTASATLTVTANLPPTGVITAPLDGSLFSAGETINFAATATDPEGGPLTYAWNIVLYHNDTGGLHTHPALTGTGAAGVFNIPNTGHPPTANVWYRLTLIVTDSANLTHTSFVEIQPRVAALTLTTNPPGLALTFDGQPITAPFTQQDVAGSIRPLVAPSPQTVGANTYQFVGWSDGGAQTHNITVPTTATTYTATYQLVPPGVIVPTLTPFPSSAPNIGVFDPALSKIGELPAGGFGLVGEVLTWVITARNNGTVAGTNVIVTDTIRDEMRIDSVSTAKGSYSISGQTVTFNIGTLNSGESVEMRIVTTVLRSPISAPLENVAALNGLGGDGAAVTRSARAEALIVTMLPATGLYERPAWLPPMIGLGVLALAGVLLARRRRGYRRD